MEISSDSIGLHLDGFDAILRAVLSGDKNASHACPPGADVIRVKGVSHHHDRFRYCLLF